MIGSGSNRDDDGGFEKVQLDVFMNSNGTVNQSKISDMKEILPE
jgi:hypothetical protein